MTDGPHQRRCWDCGNVAEHGAAYAPYVLCLKCGSQDTRRVKPKEPCQHIWNAHSQCQWCHRDRKDIDYEDGLRDVRDLLLLVSPNITPMESLSGLVSQLNNYTAGLKADRDERAVQKGQFFAAMETLRDEKDAIKNEVCVVLMMLDELAELWGDEGKFRTCRDRLRKLLPVPR